MKRNKTTKYTLQSFLRRRFFFFAINRVRSPRRHILNYCFCMCVLQFNFNCKFNFKFQVSTHLLEEISFMSKAQGNKTYLQLNTKL